ncbi:hypothetical protein QCD60_08600 [Pokkaliibacter sp. MBI-7]|uniref:hypothetical protein n=1 Tax=Pokkaliibacter sp. MBI-7 TaxID=3040600 RepID=UPI002446F658|nr:hypothetical protein [Pokkaliibacter sp. MBI-7]MDH2432625.1 hypothetical protein [Pokkaliibacter sp. MBI-7]
MGQRCIAGATRQLKPGELTSPDAWECFLQDNPHLRHNAVIHPGTPYVVRTSTRAPGHQCLAQLNELTGLTPGERANIAELVRQLGLEGTLALADFYEESMAPINHHLAEWRDQHWRDGIGAAAGGWAARNTVLMDQVTAYEQALRDVRKAHQNKQPAHVLRRVEGDTRAAWRRLNEQFRVALEKHFAKVKGRGTIWSSADRGIDIAKSHRDDTKLNLSGSRDIALLRGLARASNIAGNSMLVLEVGARGKKVVDQYRQGGDWMRTATVQSTGLALGFLGGALGAGLAADAAVAIGLAATPLGWVMVLGVGIAAAYFAASALDTGGQWASSSIYDRRFNSW